MSLNVRALSSLAASAVTKSMEEHLKKCLYNCPSNEPCPLLAQALLLPKPLFRLMSMEFSRLMRCKRPSYPEFYTAVMILMSARNPGKICLLRHCNCSDNEFKFSHFRNIVSILLDRCDCCHCINSSACGYHLNQIDIQEQLFVYGRFFSKSLSVIHVGRLSEKLLTSLQHFSGLKDFSLFPQTKEEIQRVSIFLHRLLVALCKFCPKLEELRIVSNFTWPLRMNQNLLIPIACLKTLKRLELSLECISLDLVADIVCCLPALEELGLQNWIGLSPLIEMREKLLSRSFFNQGTRPLVWTSPVSITQVPMSFWRNSRDVQILLDSWGYLDSNSADHAGKAEIFGRFDSLRCYVLENPCVHNIRRFLRMSGSLVTSIFLNIKHAVLQIGDILAILSNCKELEMLHLTIKDLARDENLALPAGETSKNCSMKLTDFSLKLREGIDRAALHVIRLVIFASPRLRQMDLELFCVPISRRDVHVLFPVSRQFLTRFYMNGKCIEWNVTHILEVVSKLPGVEVVGYLNCWNSSGELSRQIVQKLRNGSGRRIDFLHCSRRNTNSCKQKFGLKR